MGDTSVANYKSTNVLILLENYHAKEHEEFTKTKGGGGEDEQRQPQSKRDKGQIC